MQVTAKPWYRSSVIWLNVVALVGIVAGVVVDTVGVFPGMSPLLGAQIAVVAGAILAIANAALRLLRTSQPLSIQGVVPSVHPPDPKPPTPG